MLESLILIVAIALVAALAAAISSVGGPAVSLNLFPGAIMDLKLSQKLPLFIAPTDALGDPAPVTDVKWEFSPAEAGALNATDLGAEFVPAKVGEVQILVSATNAEGVVLVDALSFVVVEPAKVAVALNLKSGDPVSK